MVKLFEKIFGGYQRPSAEDMAKGAKAEIQFLLGDAREGDWNEVSALVHTELNAFREGVAKKLTKEEREEFKKVIKEVDSLFQAAKSEGKVKEYLILEIENNLQILKQALGIWPK